ncbi:hypothetical protein [Thermaerobacillus caldiproteolyticus]|uniref:Uncharacterized protein n=1 Tax=Thermaerobacillus caldiproteolyticus TaxID=247480 RepID=A0A7V9Z7L0_9BACL|nr:hypothetical protein [Anoxybacillus caldiproteolyticus]MBA2875524.1 hypothetical protein [Anoxybacillus caldiproteolyticus]
MEHETTDMTQLLEIINAKGDAGELEQIVHPYVQLICNDELFWKELRVIAEDSAKDNEEEGNNDGSHAR